MTREVYLPSTADLSAAVKEIQDEWTPAERDRRLRGTRRNRGDCRERTVKVSGEVDLREWDVG